MRWLLPVLCVSLAASAAQALSNVPVDPGQFQFPLIATQGSMSDVLSPGVKVGFNPQPDPPGLPAATLDLSNPFLPAIRADGDGSVFRFLFALERPSTDSGQFEFVMIPPGPPDDIAFDVVGRNGNALLHVHGHAANTNGGHLDPGSLVGFNPQPDPPGFQSIGFDFSFGMAAEFARTLSFATLSFDMTDAAGNAYYFTSVPEPATLSAVGAGLVLLAARRRR